MDDRLKHLVEKLGMAINDSISSSEQIPGVIAQIAEDGYKVSVFLNATIAVMKRDEEPVSLRAQTNGGFASGFNSEDLRFLKSMHISVNK